ncbi:MAG TPA: alpha/beta hydrolase [Rhizomicrobium sp.]|nr:alpha/beta hydrolase [Rhizomicrobium sp.]
MPDFATAADGVRLAYDVVGQGPPVLLIHGFASSRTQNWKDAGWYQTLSGAGYQVVAMDCRGHGESDKPHEMEFYGHDKMAEDARTVMTATGIAPTFLMGYSMGGFISLHLLLEHPDELRKLAIGGVGATYLNTSPQPGNRMADPQTRNRIADALIEPDKSKIADPTARIFRDFADQSGKDRLALAACMRAMRRNFPQNELRQSQRPVLVVCGENDVLTGPPGPLASAFADGRAVTVPRRDHMTTVGDKVYKAAVLEFFGQSP